jgi:predicted ester cyclase
MQLKTNEAVAREYATFWNTGNETLARDALAANFVDKTPPEGRKQGPEGAILASRAFRTAVPDLRCDVEQMIISGDRVVSHLHFRHSPDIWQAERKGAENRFYRHGYL